MNLKITREIFDAYRRGDKEVSNMIFELAYDRTKNYVRKIIKSEVDSEELTQEIYLIIWEKRETLKTPEAFYSYLYSVIRSKINDYFRNKKTQIVFTSDILNDLDDLCEELAPDAEQSFISKEVELLLEKTVSQMSEQKRRVFSMYRMEGRSVLEIATKLKISEKTVRNHIYLAAKELKDLLLMICVIILSRF